MPKYWVNNYFAHGRFPEVGSRKTAKKNLFFLKKFKFTPQKYFFFAYIFYLCQNIGRNKFSSSGVSPTWVKNKRHKRKREKKREERKSVITMASYAIRIVNATSGGASKPPKPKSRMHTSKNISN